MKKHRILFVSQEIFPYLEETHMSGISRYLPQGIQEKGKEIRTFMPRYGCVNERRNQLHEVIRLSGMNVIINSSDHPLIIKVASIQSARMQVYFIDNEEYFQRKAILTDANNNDRHFADNDERSYFFCKGVLETVKKLGWSPDIIHCHGWMTSALPMLVKKGYGEDPIFAESKVVYSVYNDHFEDTLDSAYASKFVMDGFDESDVKRLAKPNFSNLTKHAIDYSDAVIKGSESIHSDIEKHLKNIDIPVLSYQSPESYIEAYSSFYDEVLENVGVMAE